MMTGAPIVYLDYMGRVRDQRSEHTFSFPATIFKDMLDPAYVRFKFTGVIILKEEEHSERKSFRTYRYNLIETLVLPADFDFK
jgi:hypothetical protein